MLWLLSIAAAGADHREFVLGTSNNTEIISEI